MCLFFVPRWCHVAGSVHFPHFFAEIKIYHLYLLITTVLLVFDFLGQNILGVRGFLALFLSRKYLAWKCVKTDD